MKRLLVFAITALATLTQAFVIGSKAFTESYILGDLAVLRLQEAGLHPLDHKVGMGKTIILWQALTGGSIDVYPEYTGTIASEILKLQGPWDHARLRTELQAKGIGITEPLGFQNTYALVMQRTRAQQLGITKISDLRNHPDLAVGVTLEFLGRKDGWKPLVGRYGLQMQTVKGIEHSLGYQALASGDIAIKDAYSTDAAIADKDLVVLQDDLEFFPKYQAVYLYRLSLPEAGVNALSQVAGMITEQVMTRFNAEAERTKNHHAAAAGLEKAIFPTTGGPAPLPPKTTGGGGTSSTPTTGTSGTASPTPDDNPWSEILKHTGEHLGLVGMSMAFAILIGVPLGIAAAKPGWPAALILSVTGLVQTIPSLALFAVLVPWLGTQPRTAILALFLYSLLPIVRNTAAGLRAIPPSLQESAQALGLEPIARLWKVELPLALPTILAGIKTSAVINVGTAAIAAFIGAGGLGEPIQTGLGLSDTPLILRGAASAAVLALLVQLAFDLLERFAVPRGLRLRSQAAG
jgi:osmoprotectant transport system permease protein